MGEETHGCTCEPTALVPASSRRGSSYRELRATAHRRIRSQLPRYARQPVAQRKSADFARFVRPSRRLVLDPHVIETEQVVFVSGPT